MLSKRAIALLFIWALLLSSAMAVSPSDWAVDEVSAAYGHGLVPAYLTGEDGTRSITRGEFAHLLLNAYRQLVTTPAALCRELAFTDLGDCPEEQSFAIQYAWRYGLVNGITEDGSLFAPLDPLTREQAAVMLANMLVSGGLPRQAGEAIPFVDQNHISSWALTGVDIAARSGYMKGNDFGAFAPQGLLSLQEGVVLAERLFSAEGAMPTTSLIPTANADSLSPTWRPVEEAAFYELSIVERRAGYPRAGIEPLPPVYAATEYAAYLIKPNPNRIYHITVRALDHHFDVISTCLDNDFYQWGPSPKALESWDAIAAAEDPSLYLAEITVPVWKLQADGSKLASTMTFTANSELAEEFQAVFQEIFDGAEQFPIQQLHAWRAGGGEHGRGTAVDLNYSQNYCIYANGTMVGDFWLPGENPYSITPYGDVVQAFERHGFTWGGDAWEENQDYMHFSYYGR